MKSQPFNCLTSYRMMMLLTIGLFFYSPLLWAQVSVTGSVVTKENNLPLPGANVLIKGSNTGTVTDFDGQFSIQVNKGEVLVISYLGYLPQEIEIGEETNFRIVLEVDPGSLDEIVVVGYGSKSKTKLISAVSTVDEKTLKKIPVCKCK